MKEKKIAAFFDIDGTLYRDSLMTEHFKKLIKYEVVDEKYWLNGVKDSNSLPADAQGIGGATSEEWSEKNEL